MLRSGWPLNPKFSLILDLAVPGLVLFVDFPQSSHLSGMFLALSSKFGCAAFHGSPAPDCGLLPIPCCGVNVTQPLAHHPVFFSIIGSKYLSRLEPDLQCSGIIYSCVMSRETQVVQGFGSFLAICAISCHLHLEPLLTKLNRLRRVNFGTGFVKFVIETPQN